jgi:hypothetical protein
MRFPDARKLATLHALVRRLRTQQSRLDVALEVVNDMRATTTLVLNIYDDLFPHRGNGAAEAKERR